MANLKISGKMMVKSLQKAFKASYGLSLRVYYGAKFASPEDRLASICEGELKDGDLELPDSIKVGDFEELMLQEYGIKVQVATADNKKLTDNNFELKALKIIQNKGKYGFVDTQGNEVIPCIYENAWDFKEGFAMVEKERKYGFIDKTGEEIVPCIYENAWDFKEGFAKVEKERKYGFVDKIGKEVVSCTYQNLEREFLNERMRAKKDEKYGLIDNRNQVLLPFIYEDVQDSIYGLVSIKQDGKWGLLDKNLNELISPKYVELTPLSPNFSAVLEGRKAGLVENTTGKLVIPCMYDWIEVVFNEKMVLVRKNNTYGFLDINGNEILPFVYEKAYVVNESYVKVSKEWRKWTLIDSEGKESSTSAYIKRKKSEYDWIETVDPEVDLVPMQVGDKYGFLEKTNIGEEFVPPIYDEIIPYDYDFYVKRKGRYTRFSSEEGVEEQFPYMTSVKV